jgi:hypothetical protein
MRDPKRIPKIIEKLQKVWEQNPDLRLGQLIVNLVPRNRDSMWVSDPFYVEDNEWESSLDSRLEEIKNDGENQE